jgi:raffinose/stachyose/melibiose transport system permease protein
MKFLFSSKLIAWYFIMPVFAIHLLVVAFPSLSSLALSLTDWNGFGKINYIGFENFTELFDDRVFKKAVKHNLIWTAFL